MSTKGGLIDLKVGEGDRLGEVSIRVTQSTDELEQLVKTCKAEKQTLINVYTSFDTCNDLSKLSYFPTLFKMKTTKSNYYTV